MIREPFGFFDPGVIGLPAGIILIIYMIFAGPYILPHHIDEESASFAREQNQLIEVKYIDDASPSGIENSTLDIFYCSFCTICYCPFIYPI